MRSAAVSLLVLASAFAGCDAAVSKPISTIPAAAERTPTRDTPAGVRTPVSRPQPAPPPTCADRQAEFDRKTPLHPLLITPETPRTGELGTAVASGLPAGRYGLTIAVAGSEVFPLSPEDVPVSADGQFSAMFRWNIGGPEPLCLIVTAIWRDHPPDAAAATYEFKSRPVLMPSN